MTEPERDEAFAGAAITCDEVLEETVLIPVEALGEPAEGPEKRRAAAVEPGGAGFDLTIDETDWNRWDQIVVPVWTASGDGARLGVTLTPGTSTTGLHAPDQFHVWASLGADARHGCDGWQDVLLPYENFHIVGIPAGWSRIEQVELRLSGNEQRAYIGPVRGERRRRSVGPRLIRRALFEELELNRPDLAAVRERPRIKMRGLGGEGFLPNRAPWCAEQALVDHFRSRSAPAHVFPRVGDNASVDAADRLLGHVILDQALPRVIDWRANPNGYLEWRHAFNRHGWMRPLLAAYAHTKNERYAAELDSLLHTWIEQNPAPVGNNGGGDPAWETLSTAVRIYGIWLDIWFGLQASPSFRDETRLTMLRSIWAHAEHLMEHSVTWHNNWEIVESEAIALTGILFPEFKRAAAWREEGLRRLWGELRRQVHPDGMQWELSPGYHMMSGQGFVLPFQIARLNGIDLPEDVPERLERMFDAIRHLTRPDGTLPSLNDSGGVEARGAAWLRLGRDLFDRPDLAWVAGDRDAGEPPQAGSHALEHAGLYVMRSGWQRDDRWLVFDGAPLGHSHQHEDKLSFELYAFGTRFILDPGISSYMREPWTDYFRSAWAHNTIAIDGRSQKRGGGRRRPQDHRSVKGENLWAAGEVIDVVGSAYDKPYAGLEGAFIHRRWVVFVKPDYWLILDEVTGAGTHTVESLLHFAPMRLRVGEGQELVCTDRLGKPNLDVLALPQSRRWRVALVTGRNEPVQGWITAGNRSILPAPAAVMSRRAELPIRLGVVLVPYATGTNSSVTIERLRAPRGAWAAAIHLPDGRTDRVHVAWDVSGSVAGTGLRTDGRFAIVRCDATGRPESAAVVEGRALTFGRRRLIDETDRRPLIDWRRT